MQAQNCLKPCHWGNLYSFCQWKFVIVTVLLFSVCAPYGAIAQELTQDEIAAQRKKAEELLDTASAQLDRQQYQACQKTLERCDAYQDSYSSSQRKRFAKYSENAQTGIVLQQNAETAIQAGMQHFNEDQLGPAQEQFKVAYSLRKYLPTPQRKKIEDQLKVIKAKQKLQKKHFISLFKKSKSDYKAGRLDQAEEGFTKVQLSGIKLGFFDTGDLTSTKGYLKKIAGKKEKQAKAEKQRQQALIAKPAEEPLPVVVTPAPEAAESIPEVAQPTPEPVEPAPEIEVPAPKVVEPTPKTAVPAPKAVEPAPETVEPTPEDAKPTPVVEETAPVVVEPTPKVAVPAPKAVEPAPETVEPTPKAVKAVAKTAEPTRKITAPVPESKEVISEDELTQAAVPSPTVTTLAKPKPEKPAEMESPSPVVETKQKTGPFEFLKKKKPEVSPEILTTIRQTMALADQAMYRDNYNQAKQLFLRVLALDPEHQAAKEGLAAVEYLLSRPKASARKTESTILERLIEKEDRQRKFVEASFTEARQSVFQFMAQNQFDAARAQVTSVLAKIDGHKQLLDPVSYQRMRNEANTWLDRIKNDQQEYNKQVLLDKQEEAQKKRTEMQRRIEAARIHKIEELYNRALSYKESQEYEQAIATLHNLLELDPKNERAQIILDNLEEMLLILRQARSRSKIEIERQKNLTDLDESSIPYRDKITYPGQEENFEEEVDWLSLTKRRKQTLAGITPVDQEVYDKLSTQKIPVDYQETEFSQVLSDLQNTYQLNLTPLWGSLETTAGISRDDTITMQLENVTLEKALDSILEYVSSGKYAKAAYTIDMGVITIASEEDLPERYYIREYYVADLVGMQAMGMGGMGGMGMGGMGGRGMGGMGMGGMGMGGMGMGGMRGNRGSRGGTSGRRRGGFGMGYNSNQGRYEGEDSSSDLSLTMYGGGYGGSSRRGGMGGMSRGMGMGGMGGGMGMGMSGMGMGNMMGGTRIYELIYLIQQTVGYDQWEGEDELEQAKGTIDIHGYNVILVKQTWKNHRIIEQLLKQLRKTVGEQVALEIRLLEINSNFLEDIGLDIDFFLNLGNAGYDNSGEFDTLTGRQILIPRSNPGPWNRTTPVPIIQRSYDMTVPATTSIPGSLGGGLNNAFLLSGSFLDNVQVDFLMRATQAHQRSRFLDAPHVTVFNGESASVSFGVTQPYVSTLTAVTDNRIGIYEPDMDQANTGVDFTITPTITADKRYVILNVYFQLSNVLRFETFSFNVGGDTTTTETTDDDDETGTTGDEGLVISGGSASTGTVQQPVMEENTINTRVMVPDGGTLMLGGRKRSTEVEKEVGVPALSKLPLINRLFTNRSIVNDSSVLLILVKPKIILPKEEEELRFGKFETDAASGMYR